MLATAPDSKQIRLDVLLVVHVAGLLGGRKPVLYSSAGESLSMARVRASLRLVYSHL